MAGDWIKMRGNLWDDPRVGALADAADSTEAAIVGGLYWLWATADQHTEDGILPGLSLRRIDSKTGIPGLGAALVSIGWIAEVDGGIRIERFEEHNGASAKKRAVTAKRVANHRGGNDDVTPPALPDEAGGVTDALAREREEEEKRKRDSEAIASGGEPPADPAAMTKAELWKAGKSVLAEQGMPADQCGSFVGKLCKNWTDAVVIEAVRATVVKRPADAAEFLVATCQVLAGTRKPQRRPTSHSGLAEKNYSEGVKADGTLV
ncbi:MAG: hypothetical protein JWR07_1941 [Nevskia sp.]|nr:hypothetical protein [Nevskia sp.]